jgi:alkanesulfonate monooxygenase
VFVVFPPHAGAFGGAPAQPVTPAAFSGTLDEHCGWAEKLGAAAMLVYDFPSALDPWVAAQEIMSRTTAVEPIVAVLPALAHPAMVARAVASLSYLYGRRVNLNVVHGAKAADLAARGVVPTTDRYARMAEFIAASTALLSGDGHDGSTYRLDPLTFEPRPPAPRVLVPGSRTAESAAVLPYLDRALVMAKPLADIAAEHERLAGWGLRGGLAMIVDVIARDTDGEAFAVAAARHTGTRRDALIRAAFARDVTSSQHRAVLDLAAAGALHDGCLWLGAATVGIDCPKLVGSYQRVADALTGYAEAGVATVVLDLPRELGDYTHTAHALSLM